MAAPGEPVLALWTSLPMACATIAVAIAASALLTWAWLALARRRGIADAPGQRRLHANSTPRGGGVAIAVLAVSTALGIAVAQRAGPGLLPWGAIAAGLAAFAAVGLRDDLSPLGALPKFGGQWVAAGLLVFGLLLAGPGRAGWLAFAILAFAAVGSVQTSTPARITRPSSGVSRPVTIDRVVVLPAPFGPTRPKNDPTGTSRSMWSTAGLPPNDLVRPRSANACPAT